MGECITPAAPLTAEGPYLCSEDRGPPHMVQPLDWHACSWPMCKLKRSKLLSCVLGKVLSLAG